MRQTVLAFRFPNGNAVVFKMIASMTAANKPFHLTPPSLPSVALAAAGNGSVDSRTRTSESMPMDWRLSFDGAAAAFVDGVLDGRQPAQDVQAARHLLQVSLAIYESGRTGHAVRPDSLT